MPRSQDDPIVPPWEDPLAKFYGQPPNIGPQYPSQPPTNMGWQLPDASPFPAFPGNDTYGLEQPTGQTQGLTDTGAPGAGGFSQTGTGAPGGGLFNPDLYAPFTGQFTAPADSTFQLPNLPQFQGPTWQQPAPYVAPKPFDPFNAPAPFSAPTLQEAKNEPGYQFSVNEGERALEQSAAARGVLRTGGTLKDLLNYGQKAGEQNYGNVYNRNLGTYETNYRNALDAYGANLGAYQTNANIGLGAYQTNLGATNTGFQNEMSLAQAKFAPELLGYQTEAAAAQANSQNAYNRAWQQYLNSQDVFYNNQNYPYNKLFGLAQLGAGVA